MLAGGALLPIAADFAETGIVAALLIFFTVAACHVYASELLLWQSAATGHTELELVAGALGGPVWQVCRFQL